MSESCFTLELPADYPLASVLAFHARDVAGIAERVSARRLEKGFVWLGEPAVLEIDFLPDRAEVLFAGEAEGAGDARGIKARVAHMLGLTQNVAAFEAAFGAHPQVGALISRHPGLRIPQSATPFEALSWAITGQQISVAAALSLRRKLILACGLRKGSGLACYPDPVAVAALGVEALRGCGFSAAKAQTLDALAGGIVSARFVLPEPETAGAADALGEALGALRGVGPWTRNYTLLRAYAAVDASLHGDVAVRRAIARIDSAIAPLTEKTAQIWLAQFAPWRALLAVHLWASVSTTA